MNRITRFLAGDGAADEPRAETTLDPTPREAPATGPAVPDQPKPLSMWVNHVALPSGPATIITRRWDGDVSGRCGLCPARACGLYADVCQVIVQGFIPLTECGLYQLPMPGAGKAMVAR